MCHLSHCLRIRKWNSEGIHGGGGGGGSLAAACWGGSSVTGRLPAWGAAGRQHLGEVVAGSSRSCRRKPPCPLSPFLRRSRRPPAREPRSRRPLGHPLVRQGSGVHHQEREHGRRGASWGDREGVEGDEATSLSREDAAPAAVDGGWERRERGRRGERLVAEVAGERWGLGFGGGAAMGREKGDLGWVSHGTCGS
jgi:hypothetical protein